MLRLNYSLNEVKNRSSLLQKGQKMAKEVRPKRVKQVTLRFTEDRYELLQKVAFTKEYTSVEDYLDALAEIDVQKELLNAVSLLDTDYAKELLEIK